MPTVEQIEIFLSKVDEDFPVPLSHKQNLSSYAYKLWDKATLCAEIKGDEIISLVAGYTQNLTDEKAYIAIVATLPSVRGCGLASKLVKQFLDICRKKQIAAVHLYAVPTNLPAIKMYEGLGFQRLFLAEETRPADVHLIRYLEDFKI